MLRRRGCGGDFRLESSRSRGGRRREVEEFVEDVGCGGHVRE